MSYIRNLVSMAVLSTGSAVVLLSQSAFAETVNLRFSWKLKGEYAFFYLGQKSGLYRDAGIDVNLGEGAGAQSALASVVQGREDLAVIPGIFAITAIQKGMPVKIVALYQPAAPVVLLSHQASPVARPADLEGKSIASAVGETSTAYLDVFCSRNRIDCSKIKKINMDTASGRFFRMRARSALTIYGTAIVPGPGGSRDSCWLSHIPQSHRSN